MTAIDTRAPPVVLTLSPLTTLCLAETLPCGSVIRQCDLGGETANCSFLRRLEALTRERRNAYRVPNIFALVESPPYSFRDLLDRILSTGCGGAELQSLLETEALGKPDREWAVRCAFECLYYLVLHELRRVHKKNRPHAILCKDVPELGDAFSQILWEERPRLFCYGNSDHLALLDTVGESKKHCSDDFVRCTVDGMCDMTQARGFDPIWGVRGKVPKLTEALWLVGKRGEQGVTGRRNHPLTDEGRRALQLLDESDPHNPVWDAEALAEIVRCCIDS